MLAFRISASYGETNNMPRVRQRLSGTLDELRSIPGVTSAALTLGVPGGGQTYTSQFHIAGQDTESEGKKVFADEENVTPDFFGLLGIPILSGDTCRMNSDPKAQVEAMVSRSFADQYFPGQSPLGHYVEESPTRFQITGVVADIRKHGYAHDPQPIVYWCGLPYNPGPEFLLRTDGDPLRLSEAVRQRIRQIEPNRAVYDVKRLSDYVSSTLTERRFQMILLSSFAVTALLLATIGLYGVTSFLVSLRTREIGLRAALGATPSRIFAQVFRREGAFMNCDRCCVRTSRSRPVVPFHREPSVRRPAYRYDNVCGRTLHAGLRFRHRAVAASSPRHEYRSDGGTPAGLISFVPHAIKPNFVITKWTPRRAR